MVKDLWSHSSMSYSSTSNGSINNQAGINSSSFDISASSTNISSSKYVGNIASIQSPVNNATSSLGSASTTTNSANLGWGDYISKSHFVDMHFC
jgi:hypothetical protein